MATLITVPQSLSFVAYWESILAPPLHLSLTLHRLNSVFLVPYSCAHKNLHVLYIRAEAAANYPAAARPSHGGFRGRLKAGLLISLVSKSRMLHKANLNGLFPFLISL